MFSDYLKEKTNKKFVVEKVVLIEPSELALKRAFLHVLYSLKSLKQPEEILTFNKELDHISNKDIESQKDTVKVHIFSNIIDVEEFDLNLLHKKIQTTQKGTNVFVCVSPNISATRNQRLDLFQQYFSSKNKITKISSRESDIFNPSKAGRPHRRYERIFKVDFV